MPFLGFGNGPYMAWPKKLVGFDQSVLNSATYQVMPSPHGVPMIQLDLAFSRFDWAGNRVKNPMLGANQALVSVRWAKTAANPDMSVVVLMDISGSMIEAWRDNHVTQACSAILNYIQSAGEGFGLILYNDNPHDCGLITDDRRLRDIINRHRPSGGTYLTEALQMAVRKYKAKKGLYIIVITDGEFADKQYVSQMITKEMLPHITPDNPFAFRLHFVGAGEQVDEKFLQQLELLASGQGVQMVASDHHAHLSHSHGNILDELDRSFIGRNGFLIGEVKPPTAEESIIRIGDLTSRKWLEGHQAQFDFMPSHALIGMEYQIDHPSKLPIAARIPITKDDERDVAFLLPMPRSTSADTRAKISQSASDSVQTGSEKSANRWSNFLRIPFFDTPEEAAVKATQKQHIAEIYAAEQERQSIDLKELASGGIPVQARDRLLELAADPNSLFTSDLAPDELALLRRCGFKPRGLVTGSAMYHVGQAYASSTGDCEVQVLSHAYDQACSLAISRMKKELRLIQGHGVIGVRLKIERREWSEKSIEVQAIGTAIEGPAGYAREPWTSDLSGQEWYTLWQAGYEPTDLVWGHCSWFVLTTLQDENIEKGTAFAQFGNREMEHWSSALSTARHIAMRSVQQRAREARSTGIVGVRVNRRLSEVRLRGYGEDPAYEREHHNLLVSIVGTAIKIRANAPEKVRGASYALSLRDGRLKPLSLKQEADLEIS